MTKTSSSARGLYQMVLFVDSTKPLSQVAAERLREVCLEHIPNAYSLQVYDLEVDQPLFERHRVIAVPTLDVITPEYKTHRFIGDVVAFEAFIVAAGMARTAIQQFQDARKMQLEAADMRERVRDMSADGVRDSNEEQS